MARVHGRYPRIACVVPFCGCGATCYPSGEIICPKHYRLVDKALKARRRRVRALFKKRNLLWSSRHQRVDSILWGRIVAQAILRAGSCP